MQKHEEPVNKFVAGWVIAIHVAAIAGLFYFPVTFEALLIAIASHSIRGFGITGGFHRYFAHRTYKTSRPFQFFLALLGTLAGEGGVLWWAALHRHHHKYSDQPNDIHSPVTRGFFWAHYKWFSIHRFHVTPFNQIQDFAKFPELMWLNKYNFPVFLAFGAALFLVGGLTLAYWGFVFSVVTLLNSTWMVNSLVHMYGSRRFETKDQSRNNWLVAILAGGEGWHNNHHHMPFVARNGFKWWEYDPTYYVIKLFSFVGLIWDVRMLPDEGAGTVGDHTVGGDESAA